MQRTVCYAAPPATRRDAMPACRLLRLVSDSHLLEREIRAAHA